MGIAMGQTGETASNERHARAWDRWVTGLIVAFLFIPFPIARFESWPRGEVVLQRLVMPWSRFQICYVSFPDGKPVEEVYTFGWKGNLEHHDGPFPVEFSWNSTEPPILKWQSAPEIVLGGLFRNGEFLRLKTTWRPLVIWPLEALWRMR